MADMAHKVRPDVLFGISGGRVTMLNFIETVIVILIALTWSAMICGLVWPVVIGILQAIF